VTTIGGRRAAFRELHTSGCFVIPNPWDAGSARYLEHVGFAALATTSSGMAFAMAQRDGGVPVDDVIAHVASIVDATQLPVNADFEDGFADDLGALADNVRRCADAGAAGLSIEDAPVVPGTRQYELHVAVDRLRTARRVLDESHPDVLLVARAQNRMSSPDDVGDALERLRAFADAGADVLYVPAAQTDEQIERVVAAAGPLPVNVLGRPPMTVARLAALGVRRVSVAGQLARVAWAAVAAAARTLLEDGDLDAAFRSGRGGPDLNTIFGA
jgi:2-methylisocitrate lyase-like PEP mutase family enzyme